ncbi:amino acid ABC transporter substrate-binding protein [Haematospirillum jordaniae]|uniref:Solute-binding protein family 3/N-terminal domain-containing protein n=1 Tax=Haematospirillum jordaniae TaxID=1549855 RepID=A0A143DDG5_9PROT|nr:transporter substrate-binding domain-containing protein [Haematospirillum jordaniae]AMW34772.1 hypothetical protein AY555_05790 [Haematospirillum jordaniae]NKD45482.1 amino acid ABC transporter substrate-binding protein [Haematospirillum jordaniae]NKD56867.1 amino acid ABC transporter substrate-binding protein [Haematospirillum jordaniae]NKD58977.1 amino acid ABC transporter substrate-binding protein [Haematospirillum jordaniae]NKD66792.1 amino acid ABC transporter substrate-binding protein
MTKRFIPVVLAAFLPLTATAAPLTFNTEDWFPYNYTKNGKVVGSSTELIKLIGKNADVEYEIVLGPWNKSYTEALNLPGKCVYTTAVTDERKPLFKWVYPIDTTRLIIYKLKGKPLTASSLDDLKGKKIGSYTDDAAAEFLKSKGFTVDEAPADNVNPKKLVTGRIDAWITTDTSGLKLAKEAGVEVEEVMVAHEHPLGLACNKSVDDAVIAKMQKALDDLIASGEADKIRQSKFQMQE